MFASGIDLTYSDDDDDFIICPTQTYNKKGASSKVSGASGGSKINNKKPNLVASPSKGAFAASLSLKEAEKKGRKRKVEAIVSHAEYDNSKSMSDIHLYFIDGPFKSKFNATRSNCK